MKLNSQTLTKSDGFEETCSDQKLQCDDKSCNEVKPTRDQVRESLKKLPKEKVENIIRLAEKFYNSIVNLDIPRVKQQVPIVKDAIEDYQAALAALESDS